jgi:hypothetical protein
MHESSNLSNDTKEVYAGSSPAMDASHSIFKNMDELIPPSTRPIPLQGNAYTFTESVRETAILAVSFAEDFERLLELYQIVDYDIYVKSKMFTLNHSSRSTVAEPTENVQEENTQIEETQAVSTESFFFDTAKVK